MAEADLTHRLREKSVGLGIRLTRLVHPPRTASIAQKLLAPALRFAPAIVATYLAYSFLHSEQPIYAFIFGLIASRLSAIAGLGLLAVTAADQLGQNAT
jgi:hypothetical protein